MPKYSSREMLFVLGCLSTCDAGNILQTIKVTYVRFEGEIDLRMNSFRRAKRTKFAVRWSVFRLKFAFSGNSPPTRKVTILFLSKSNRYLPRFQAYSMSSRIQHTSKNFYRSILVHYQRWINSNLHWSEWVFPNIARTRRPTPMHRLRRQQHRQAQGIVVRSMRKPRCACVTWNNAVERPDSRSAVTFVQHAKANIVNYPRNAVSAIWPWSPHHI